MPSRVQKSILNARINFIFYFVMLVLSFYSRKIFLDSLGADFIGLTGTLQNILNLLNIAELGVGAAIGFNLYKPIQRGDQGTINEMISLFGWLYRYIGCVILLIAFVVSLFFPLIFSDTSFNLFIIYFAFYSFLISSLIGYFVNYRSILLTADQKNYIVSAYLQSANVVKTILQIVLCIYFKNYYVWILVELCFGVIGSIILNIKIDKEYPWLKTNIKEARIYNRKYPQIMKSTRQVFVHKMKDFLLMQSDQILIFAFVSLKMVAFYGNYTLLITKASYLFNSTLDSVGAGVGNLVAEGNKDKILDVFWELMCIRYFIAGLVVTSVYLFIEPFIVLWLGEQYILSKSILILLMVNTFIFLSRGVVDNFNYAYGHYADIWAAWTEGLLNLGLTLLLAPKLGVSGILRGKIVPLLLIVVCWKPYYLFNSGFDIEIKKYWKSTLKYYLLLMLSFSFVVFIRPFILILPQSWMDFIKYVFILFVIYFILTVVLFWFFAPGIKSFKIRVFNLINNKLQK